MKILATIETPFPEKFGVPRQPLIVEEAWGKMTFPKDEFFTEAFRGIENFSHLWLIFEFHLLPSENMNPLVRPPRFDGKKKLGIFATRTPHRINRLGLSVVKFERVEILDDRVELWVSGVDLVSGTPILDIKPYLPYADSIKDAHALEFSEAPKNLKIEWLCEKPNQDLALIEKVLSLDPRPAHQRDLAHEYGMSILDLNIRFRVLDEVVQVVSLNPQSK